MSEAISITQEQVESVIAKCDFEQVSATKTLCILTLKNGYVVRGEHQFGEFAEGNEAAGREFAKFDAMRHVYPLEEYLAYEARAFSEA